MRVEARGILTGLALGTVLLAPAAGFGASLVVVRDDAGVLVSGAEVYRNCTRAGTTSGGLLILPTLNAGDHLQVRKLVETGPSAKGGHDGWSYHAWRTNISMENDGSQVDFTVTDPAATQNVVVRRQNTQIGWNVLGSVEYNATAANLDEIARGLESASTYLFDVSDGQFFLEQATLHEEREHWADADYQFFTTMWPNATGSVGAAAVLASSSNHMYLPGPGFDGNNSTPGSWPTSDGFRTIVHEHGHYGFGLWDEYVRRGGSSSCTLDRAAVPEARRASIMSYQYDATELCHDGNHNPMTGHGEITGRSTWASLAGNWAGSAWTLRTPMSRMAVNPGPDVLSCFSRMTTRVVPATSETCPPLRLTARDGSGTPIANVAVDLLHGGRRVFQGNTNTFGQIPIYGGAVGDTVSLRATSRGLPCVWLPGFATVTSTCGNLDIEADLMCYQEVVEWPLQWIRFIHQGDPAPDVWFVIPTSDPGALVRLVVEQDGLGRKPVALSYDQKLKALTGSFAVDPEHALAFELEFGMSGPKGEPIDTASRLRGARVGAAQAFGPGAPQSLFTPDAPVDVEVDAGALPEGAGVLVADALFAPAAPADRVPGATVVTVTGETALAKTATLSLRYDRLRLLPGTVQLHRLDGQQWVALPTVVDEESGRASADVDTWGTYGVFGKAQQ